MPLYKQLLLGLAALALAGCGGCMAIFVSAVELEELAATRLREVEAEPEGWLATLLGFVRRLGD